MNKYENFYEKYQAVTDADEKTMFLADIMTCIQKIIIEQENTISNLTAEREVLSSKISRAAGLIEEAQAEAGKAHKAANSATRRKLQIARDRLVVIASTSKILGTQVNESVDKSIMLDTLNNIIASIGIITNELTDLGLWDADENKPDITPVTACPAISKKRVSMKKLSEQQPDENKDQLEI